MQKFLSNHIMLSTHVVIVAVSLSFGAWYAHSQLTATLDALSAHVRAEENLLIEIANITDRNGVDTITETLISDCQRRDEFESYLVRLDTLSQKDLMLTQQLFESCGAYYSERKAIMVAKLERELQILNNLTTLILVADDTAKIPNITLWNQLVELEKNRSGLLTEQTLLQGKIISLLITGTGPQTLAISKLLEEAQAISDALTTLNVDIDKIRTTISL